jgi:RNA polymerase sigma-70 factor (ECF subfamily)
MQSDNRSGLLARVARGDQLAVGQCIDRYRNLVWAVAKRYLRNPADAEDAVQDVFTDVWRSAARYDSDIASEAAFIGTIARRRLIDRVRRAGHQPPMTALDDEDHPILLPSVQASCEADAEARIIERAIRSLDTKYQTVLCMSLGEGFTHQEIAEGLDLPIGTVKSRVRRGLSRVRALLEITPRLTLRETSTSGLS